jgi:tetratricopeptide (TPR) repeat protein/tRNA A-37 threonylcarbamoyl transferase component Bud32
VRSASDESTRGSPGEETLRPSTDARDDSYDDPEGWVDLPRGTSVGRYVVLERIGVGGMGVVYAAYDPELDRKVALKLVRTRGDDSRTSIGASRLVREAQAMAKLSHENVIVVHDVGTYGDRVFIAMEYLDGGTLTRWVRSGPPAWPEILAKLLRAGAGLAAAHDAGIVHRDFKPDNVLLGTDGRVRVMDFGLARSLTPSREVTGLTSGVLGKSFDDLDVQLTATGARVGTPAYMSPEQHRGAPLDARSDQFSFCVTAYDAFYGQRPFAGASLPELTSNVLDGVLRDPPEDTEVPPWIFEQLKRGLARDPEARHASMRALLDALAVDVGAKRRARLRGALALGALVLVGAPVGVYAVLGNRPCREGPGKLAEVWNSDAREVGRAAFGDAGSTTWSQAAAALDDYGAQWIAMYEEACRATHVDGDQSAELLDRRMGCLERRRVQMRSVIDLFADADAVVVERASKVTSRLAPIDECADVDALLAQMPPPQPQLRDRVNAVVAALEEVGTLRTVARYEQAEALVSGLEAEVEALDYPPARTEYLYFRSAVASDLGRIDEAERLAYATVEAAALSNHVTLAADAWISLAIIVGITKQDFDQVVPILHAASAAVVRNGNDDRHRARLLATSGTIDVLREDWTAAEPKLLEAHGIFERIAGAESLDAIETHERLGLVYHGQERYDEAQRIFESVLQTVERVRGPDHPSVGQVVGNLARLHKARGRLEDALPLYERSLSILSKAAGPRHPVVATAHHNLSNALRGLGRYDEAQQHLDAAISIEDELFGPESESGAANLHARALLLLAQGKGEEALPHAERAIELWGKALGPEHGRVAFGLTTKGRVLNELGRHAEAVAPLEAATKIRSDPETAPAAERGSTHFELAKALAGTDRTRAREEAAAARKLFVESERQEDIAEVDAWIARH